MTRDIKILRGLEETVVEIGDHKVSVPSPIAIKVNSKPGDNTLRFQYDQPEYETLCSLEKVFTSDGYLVGDNAYVTLLYKGDRIIINYEI